MGSIHWHSRPAYSPEKKMRLLLNIGLILFVLATISSARPNKNDESISLVEEGDNNKLRLVKRDHHDDDKEEEDDDYFDYYYGINSSPEPGKTDYPLYRNEQMNNNHEEDKDDFEEEDDDDEDDEDDDEEYEEDEEAEDEDNE